MTRSEIFLDSYQQDESSLDSEIERTLLLRYGRLNYTGTILESSMHALAARLEFAAAETRRLQDLWAPITRWSGDKDVVFAHVDPDRFIRPQFQDRLLLVLNTDGGSLEAGLYLIDFMRYIQHEYGMLVDIKCSGIVASCGSIILQGATGRRLTGLHTIVHYHGVEMSIQGNSKSVFEDHQKLSRNFEDIVVNLFASKNTSPDPTYHDVEWWREELYGQRRTGRETFLTAQETLERGLVDEVTGV